ncbi:Tn3 family transposase [Streptomyces sp. NPDC005892]|uniref:Tn3 family transposase n=1 Tax=Streptomyces sp. NPDC005892 TaxID=3155593 RepID=UPI0033DCC621
MSTPRGAVPRRRQPTQLAEAAVVVYVNTLRMREAPADDKGADKLTDADMRALSPLFWTRVNPYGRFELDMNSRLDLDLSIRAAVPGPRTPQGEPSQPRRNTGAGHPGAEQPARATLSCPCARRGQLCRRAARVLLRSVRLVRLWGSFPSREAMAQLLERAE